MHSEPKLSRRGLIGATLATAVMAPSASVAQDELRGGVNVSGLEFNPSALPGRLDTDYVAPDPAEIAYYRARGARLLRLPFLWERLQPTLGGAFDQAYVARIDAVVNQARTLNMTVSLDAHQYGRRRVSGQPRIIGESDSVTSAHFAHLWRSLATRYRQQPVWYNLVNQPHDQNRGTLVQVQNAAIAAIRAAGATQLVLASGSAWTGAHSWVSSGNAQSMLAIRDGRNNYAFDVHQYLDSDSSGSSGTCVSGSGNRLTAFTTWARQNRKRGFLGEFAGGRSDACRTELTRLLNHMRDNRDVWVGWAWWGGGAWWDDDYPFKLRPVSLNNPTDRPQMAILRRYW